MEVETRVMKQNKLMLSTSIMTAALAIGLFGGVAGAQTPPASPDTPHPIRLLGRVDAVTANAITLTTRQGKATANVGANTWIVVRQSNGRCVEGTLRDMQVNRPAAVAGMTTAQRGVINARVVTQGGCAIPAQRPAQKARDGERLGAEGTIKAISGSILTLATDRGPEVTVNTTADTVVLNSGFKSVSTLKVGDRVDVLGGPAKPTDRSTTTARTLNAWGIRVIAPGNGIATGHVQSVNGNTVTLRGTPANRAGITITFDGSTAYKSLARADGKGTLTNATQADVKVGTNLIVEGIASADGKTLTARAVILLPNAKPARPANP
jgi:hypothetical protein